MKNKTGAILLLVALPILGACNVTNMAAMSPKPSSTPETVALVTEEHIMPTVSPSKPSVFSTGSVTRVKPIDAGSKLVTKYWLTDKKAADWSYNDSVVVSLSAHLEGKIKNDVKVSSFRVTLVCGSVSLVLRDDTGDFVLTQPFEYGSALTIQCPDPVDSATLNTEFALAVRTDPTLDTYYRSTVLDSFDISFNNKESNDPQK